MKSLLPTLKERKRYILFQIYSKAEIGKEEVKEQVTKACLQFLGELGCAKAGVQFLPESWNAESKTGIIRVAHNYTDQLKASLALIKDIQGKKASINCLLASGVIGKLKNKQKEIK